MQTLNKYIPFRILTIENIVKKLHVKDIFQIYLANTVIAQTQEYAIQTIEDYHTFTFPLSLSHFHSHYINADIQLNTNPGRQFAGRGFVP